MVRRGVILSRRPITVEEMVDAGLVGDGALAGALAGSAFGNSGEEMVIGALIGGVMMVAIQTGEQDAYAYTVEIEGRRIVRVVQTEILPVGAPVFVEYSMGLRVNLAIDETQGQTFQRAAPTQYE